MQRETRPPLTVVIPIKDRNGNVVGEKEVASFAGLLAKAHEEGLSKVETKLAQAPSPNNGDVAIVVAVVETTKGTFTGIGDASPANVTRRIAPHAIRMAETRAVSRALRLAVNIGQVSLEELGDDAGDVGNGHEDQGAHPRGNGAGNGRGALGAERGTNEHATSSSHGHVAGNGTDTLGGTNGSQRAGGTGSNGSRPNGNGRRLNGQITDPQRRLLYRLLAEGGYEGDNATRVLEEAAGVVLSDISKQKASSLIDAWQERGVGHGA